VEWQDKEDITKEQQLQNGSTNKHKRNNKKIKVPGIAGGLWMTNTTNQLSFCFIGVHISNTNMLCKGCSLLPSPSLSFQLQKKKRKKREVVQLRRRKDRKRMGRGTRHFAKIGLSLSLYFVFEGRQREH